MTAPSSSATWLAIYLPRLNTDRLIRSGLAPEGRALAIYTKEAGAFQLTGVDARARSVGLRLAMSLADARAIHPKLAAIEADPAEDARTLDMIAAWCERFTPIVVIDGADGLFLDITGCAHLFGGETALRDQIVARLRAQGFGARAALAPTPGAAWALSRYGAAGRSARASLKEQLEASLAENDVAALLAPLPIEALRLEPSAAALLRRVGIKTVGQLIGKPRAPLAARLGEKAVLRLDQALGLATEALTPRRQPPPVYALRRFLEPIFTADVVLQVARDLCADAVEKLDRRGAGVLCAELVLFGVDGRDRVIGVNASRPLRDMKQLMRLFREKLNVVGENMNAEFGFEAARLDIVRLARMDDDMRALISGAEAAASAEKVTEIVDILSSRLGPKRVIRAHINEGHSPERASEWRSALAKPKAGKRVKAPKDNVQRRPIRLFSPGQPIEVMASVPDGPPIRFRWRRVLREVVRSEGPERISGDWQRREMTRDYYRVEDSKGRRYWLYREGLYGEADEPRWYVHGLFA
ncbi:Y-family DNA polymerase [Terricaulis sp.]|uniref:Y-family DNA polymerase n=1 Tax=Terricaulis sp. TaxID=2768686 RepID=UPI003783AF04